MITSLEELKKLGCGFSVDQLPSIQVDFKKLIQLNVKFIKIDAKILQSLLNPLVMGDPLGLTIS